MTEHEHPKPITDADVDEAIKEASWGYVRGRPSRHREAGAFNARVVY